MDLISREMALKEAYHITIDGEVFSVVQVETLIGLPSAERTGHWIPKNYVEYFSGDCASSFARAYTFECSECGTECPKQSKVCWECGARMKGEE